MTDTSCELLNLSLYFLKVFVVRFPLSDFVRHE
jgi:hypothetical protein